MRTEAEGSARFRNSFEEEVNHETPSRRSLAGRGTHRVISERVRLGSRKFWRARNSVHKNLGGINYERKEISTSSPQWPHRFGTYQLHRTRHRTCRVVRPWRFIEPLSLASSDGTFVPHPSLHCPGLALALR